MVNKEITKIEGDMSIKPSSDPTIYGEGNLDISGDLTVLGNVSFGSSTILHGALVGLTADDHSQYTLLAGRAGGQILTGGINSGNNTTIRSTSNATKGSVVFDETTATSSNSTGSVRILGGLGISNTTDAISATNGGTITTAGGIAVAKKAFVGTDLSVGGNSSVLGNLNVTGALSFGSTVIPHNTLTNLSNDDHLQYTLLAGRTGGQILTGGTAANNNTTIRSTSNATKGSVIFDETTATASSSTGAVRLAGGLGISNTTDATSSINGGTITTAGGLAVAKKAFVGTDLSVGGNLVVTGTATLPHGGLTGLTSDDHPIYTLLSGRTGGQVITGGINSGNNTTIRSTSNATKGSVIFDEITTSLSSSTGAVRLSGGLGISNTTDATSEINGGTITTAGGLAVAKKAFVGTDLSVGGNSSVLGNLSVTGALSFGSTVIPHNTLTNLSNDDHLQYILLSGRTGGQTLTGGIASGNNTTIRSTSNATKGSVIFDETTVASSSSTGAVRLSGGLGISNTTDATSATNGGTITTAGGLAVARRAFIGTDLSVGGNSSVLGNLSVTGALSFGSTVIPHNSLTGLLSDDHPIYTLLVGRTGGQIITGGTAASNNTTIRSTSNATKGSVVLDETTTSTSSSSGALLLSGGLGISNTTDATSSTNGGTITTAGGMSVAKKAFIGTDLSVGGNLTVTGTAAIPHSGLTGLSSDDHPIYTLIAGRTGGQTLTGGTAANNNTTIRSTSNATKGSVIFDETTPTVSNSTGAVRLSGGLGISNTTDATSATNGGTITTAGGLAVAKKAFIGTDLSVGGNSSVLGNLSVTGALSFGSTVIPHNSLTGLSADDHPQYTLLAGRTGGQIITGGTAASNNTTIRSTSNATKGSVVLDETTATSSSSSGALLLSGGLGISNATDAISSINGGTITTAGGLAVAKKAFIGTDLSVGGNLTVTGTAAIPHSGLTGLSSDDHPIYTLLAGRTGGQILTGGTASGNNTTIRSTSNATKGSVVFDETTPTVSNSTGAVRLLGGLGISNTTDATSATNGGTITTAGGLAVAKRAFIGTDLSVGGNSSVLGNLSVTGALSFGSTVIPHNSLTGLLSDDHTQYTLLAGRSGGQIITGGTAANNNTTIRSTSNATKGSVVLDETTATSSSSSGALLLSGGLGISNATDAISSINGGTITTAGGLAVAKKAFIGTDLSVGGNLTVTGSASIPHSGLTGLLSDDHVQYTLLAGRTGGQILTGGTAANNNTTIRSTSNATKGSVVLDETTTSTSSSSGALLLSGGLGISNTTDAISSTNGGTITTAGGLAVAKKAFIGTDLSVGGNLTVTGTASIPHSGLTGLASDDHLQYTLLAGRTGGQIITGGTASGNNTTIRSTSNATKGSVVLDETTTSTSSSSGALLLSGGLGISNATDATSATNGGTITTAGGLAVAKKAFIGTDLSVGGNLTVTGTASFPHSGLTGLSSDDHLQYTLIAGRSGGQTLTGGINSGNNIVIRSTSNATKGSVIFDENTATSSSSTGAVRLLGGLGIFNTTDATSATNGGTITTAGGLAVARRAFIGTDLSVGGNSSVLGNFSVTGALSFGSAVIPHNSLTGLASDDHPIYTLLAGRTGGQIITGGTAASNNTTIRSTSNATKGSVVLDETTATSSNSSGALLLSGGLGISNATDAISSINGGTITTAGGLAVAKKAFIGTDLSVGGNLTVTGTASIPHSGLTGLAADDHLQYTLLAGRTGGQIITGGTAASNNTTIRSTSNATKGSVVFDETTPTVSNSTGAVRLLGGLGISNTTDATSATNGGTITTAGGLAVARRAFIGTDLSVGGNLTVTGTASIPHSGLTGLLTDDHTQYTLLAGRTGGQIITGGTASGNNTTIRSTSNATKGSVVLDEPTVSSSSSSGALLLSGGLGISNATDAISSTNGGTITTAGGLAVAKKAFIGTDLSVGGNLTVTGTASIPHGGLTGLSNDDHTIYTLLSGRVGGQIITGGINSGNNTTIRSTSNATKGSVIFDETTPTVSNSTGAVRLLGGLGISNTTDATSATNGGTITTAGGLSVAKKAFVGTDLSVGGNFSVSGIATVPAPNPSNNGEIVNVGYLNSVGSTLPPKIYNDMALVTDLSEPTQAKWKGGSIYSPDIDLDKTRHLRLAKIGNQIINPGNAFINFGYRLVIDSSHFEQLYGKTAYLIKVPGRYYVSGTIITGTDSFSNSTTAAYFIQLTEIVSGITTIRPGSEIYSTHATSTTLGTDSVSFGCCIVVPVGGSFFSMRCGRTSGASITSIRNGSNISVVSIADSEYLDVYSTAYTILNNASYVDIPMTATYYADTLYNFTAPNANVGVTTTGTYLVSAKVTFLRPTISGSNPVGRFRLVDQSGTPITDAFGGSTYNPFNGAVLVSNATATWTGLLNITATTGTIKIQAIIDFGSGELQAIGGLCLTSVNTTAFPSQLNFRTVSTSNQLLSTTVFNIPWQSALINTGGISLTPGTTQITVTKSSLYCISGSIPILVPLNQTNILVTVNVLISYDNGSTFRNVTTAPIIKLAANNMSVPFCFFTNLFPGARIRLTINTSGSTADLVALGSNCSLSILSFDDLTTPVDLFPVKGSFYKFCENSEFLTLPTTSITVVNSIWSKYVPAGLYKISFNTSVGIGTANTIVSYTINQSAENRGDNAVYTRGGNYVSIGEYPIGFSRVVTFDKGINYIFVSITSNRVNTVTVTASLLDIERVI